MKCSKFYDNIFVVGFITLKNIIEIPLIISLVMTQVTRRDDSKLWIAYSNIQGKSSSLKEKQGEGGDPDLKPSTDAEGNVIPIAEEADKWVLKVCEEIINEYKDQFTLEELIFGPGMFESLVRLINFKNSLALTH